MVKIVVFRFATVVVGSDASFRRCLDQLPKRMIHGQSPIATPANKTNLAKFEAASRKDEPTRNGMGRYSLCLLLLFFLSFFFYSFSSQPVSVSMYLSSFNIPLCFSVV